MLWAPVTYDAVARQCFKPRPVDAELAEDLFRVLAEPRRRQAQPARCFGQAGNDVVHGELSGLFVRHIDDDLARDDMRVGKKLVDVVNRRRGDLRRGKGLHVLVEGAGGDEIDDRLLAFLRIAHAIGMKMITERARLAQTRAANPNAEDLALRCSAALMRAHATSERDSAFRLCKQALQIDPENLRAASQESFKFTQRVANYTSRDRQADLPCCRRS